MRKPRIIEFFPVELLFSVTNGDEYILWSLLTTRRRKVKYGASKNWADEPNFRARFSLREWNSQTGKS